jgi:hypothetical protein
MRYPSCRPGASETRSASVCIRLNAALAVRLANRVPRAPRRAPLQRWEPEIGEVRTHPLAGLILGHVVLEELLLRVRLGEQVDVQRGLLLTRPPDPVLAERQPEGHPPHSHGDDRCESGRYERDGSSGVQPRALEPERNPLVGTTGFEPANLLAPSQARYQTAPRPDGHLWCCGYRAGGPRLYP